MNRQRRNYLLFLFPIITSNLAEKVFKKPSTYNMSSAGRLSPLAHSRVHTNGIIMTTTRYWISTFKANAAEADFYCRESGRQLVSIESEMEQFVIERNLDVYLGEDSPWTSGNDISNEGKWVWGNGQPIVYNNFVPGQKDLYTDNCLRLLGSKYVNRYKWVKDKCSEQHTFVCEYLVFKYSN